MLLGKNLLTNIFDIDKLNYIFAPLPYYPDMHIYAGNYNGRGNIEGRDITEALKEYEHTLFVNWDVWNWLILKYDDLELGLTKQGYFEEAESIIKTTSSLHKTVQIRQYMKVSYSASLLRLIPNSISLKGATEVRLEEFGQWLNLLTKLNNSKIEKDKELNNDE
jgi:hypothetical protein